MLTNNVKQGKSYPSGLLVQMFDTNTFICVNIFATRMEQSVSYAHVVYTSMYMYVHLRVRTYIYNTRIYKTPYMYL